MTREDVKIALQAVLDFIIVSGSTLGGAMLQSGVAVIPGSAVQLLAVIMGATAAARRIQAMLEGSPKEALADTVKQLVAQMRTIQVLTAQTLPDPAAARPGPAPITPKRVDLPAPTPKEG